jgi:hypothetical protein
MRVVLGESIFLKSPVEGVEPLTKLEIIEWIVETELDKVSQLLSERTFSKEELKRISKRVNEWKEDKWYEDELDCRIVDKISKLLKEGE